MILLNYHKLDKKHLVERLLELVLKRHLNSLMRNPKTHPNHLELQEKWRSKRQMLDLSLVPKGQLYTPQLLQYHPGKLEQSV